MLLLIKMNIRTLAPLLILTTLGVGMLVYVPTGASSDNRVALVVDYGNGQVAKRCVSFPEEQITGFEALQRSGLPVETDFQSGGAAVCRIDGQGCPANDCFCSCRGGDGCKYWSYWHFINGVWNYSAGGSSIYQLQDGAVDGWVWGLGSVTQASPPPIVTFNEICASAAPITPTTTATASPSSTPVVLPTTAAQDETGPVQTATPTLTVTVGGNPLQTVTLVLTPQNISTTVAISPTLSIAVGAGGGALPAAPSALAIATATSQTPPGNFSTPSTGDRSAIPSQPSSQASPVPQIAQNADVPQADPTSILVTPEEIINSLPSSATIVGEVTNTPPPVVVAAVVGDQVALGEGSQAVSEDEQPGAFNLISYAGFAGLMLLLGSLGLLTYHRRRGV